ncbi:hypothetical protein BaRGS_00031712 [Batillaria attramentaria]|uniref:Uncharacterized protein n=1 Tax=Batillaria attramentaria TaxID=370345 RepID=A0ABD0JR75_9CAEN
MSRDATFLALANERALSLFEISQPTSYTSLRADQLTSTHPAHIIMFQPADQHPPNTHHYVPTSRPAPIRHIIMCQPVTRTHPTHIIMCQPADQHPSDTLSCANQ